MGFNSGFKGLTHSLPWLTLVDLIIHA